LYGNSSTSGIISAFVILVVKGDTLRIGVPVHYSDVDLRVRKRLPNRVQLTLGLRILRSCNRYVFRYIYMYRLDEFRGNCRQISLISYVFIFYLMCNVLNYSSNSLRTLATTYCTPFSLYGPLYKTYSKVEVK
jgi:hypothetical protein